MRRLIALALVLMITAPAPMLTGAMAADAREATGGNAAVAFIGTLWTKLLAQLGAAQKAIPVPVDDSMPGQEDPPRPEPRPIIETPSQVERQARVTSLQIGGTSVIILRLQQTRALSALPLDATGQAVHGLSATWESSVPAIASVTPEGEVTAHMLGIAVLTARVGAQTAVSTITVVNTPDPETIPAEAGTLLGRRGQQLKNKNAQLRHATWSRDENIWSRAADERRDHHGVKFTKAAMLMTDLPSNEIASLFWPENEVGLPPGRTEPGAISPPVAAPGTEMPLSANYFFGNRSRIRIGNY